MKKKLIAVAVAAGMATPMVASADLTISGRVSQDLVFSTHDEDTRSLADWGQARLQFDFTQDAGPVTAYGRAAVDHRRSRESGSDAASAPTGTNRAGGPTYREVYAGIRGDFGAIQAGRMAGALKNLEKDPYIATFLEARNTSGVGGGAYGSSSFVDDLLQYSKSFGNVNLVLQYNPTTDATGREVKDRAAVLSGSFGAVRAWVGWNNGGNAAARTNDNDADVVKVGASMAFGALDITAQYETRDDDADQNGDRIFLMANMDFGGGLSGNFAFGMLDEDDASLVDDETNWYRLAVNKTLTKGADVYAGVTHQESSTAADDVTNFGVGVTVKF